METRLQELHIELPLPAKSVANYLPYRQEGNLLFISGQLPMINGTLQCTGKMGAEIQDLDTGKQLARLCAINLLSQLRDACHGNLQQVHQCIKLTIFVATTTNFYHIADVANGASDLLVEVMGEAGKHSRSAIGVAALPLNAPIEIEAIFSLK